MAKRDCNLEAFWLPWVASFKTPRWAIFAGRILIFCRDLGGFCHLGYDLLKRFHFATLSIPNR
jgi:hypothetical protein